MKIITNTMVLFIMIAAVLAIQTNTVAAYGWGYQKTMDNTPPDVGKYADMLAGHQAIYLDQTAEKVIYFTFDNGYEQGYTEHILDVLQRENVPATFFVTGHYVEEQPKLIQRMVNDGHLIGNHSYHHPDFTKMSKAEVDKELKALEKAVAEISDQKRMTYLRPPRGTFNEKTLQWADELGYVHVFWSLAFKDWETNQQKGWKYAYDQIIDQVHPGAVVLLHTVSEDNAQALEKVIQQLKKEGYQFRSLDELMIKKALPDDFREFLF